MCENSYRCGDFYEYACGRFLESVIIPDDKVEVSTFSKIDEDLTARLQIIVNEPVDANEIKPFKDLKLLYQACMNLTAIEAAGTAPVLTKISQMGGWPVLTNGSWNDSQWSWENTVAQIKSNGANHDLIFSFTVAVDPRNSSRRLGAVCS
jgi:predicted metalloendopeptidase